MRPDEGLEDLMMFRASTAAGAMVIGAMTIAGGTAYAQPAPVPAQTDVDYINYDSRVVGRTVVTELADGTFELVDKPGAAPGRSQQVLQVKNRAGHVALEMPLNFRLAGVPIPVTAAVEDDNTVLALTPERPEGIDTSHPLAAVVQPIASPVENQRAVNDFATKLSLGAGVGTAIGAVIGVVLGIGIGTVLGLAAGAVVGCAATTVGCPAGLLVGGVVGLLAGPVVGAIGLGIVGAAIGSGPTVSTAGVEMLNTLQAPPGTTPWADLAQPPGNPVQPAPATPQPAPVAP
ncbi:hypothetical protein [Nocardia wallacei]|uniref:hypothetical protein n=1 Tax=Nocardia wallacei TaxID=480035 RepID=UPI002453E897|nr:hypothetical protein [Nocardia wallacei]